MINFDSSVPVKLKGISDGFCITLDPSFAEDSIKSEINKIFGNLKQLVEHSNIVLDVGGAKGHEKLITNIQSHLKLKFNVAKVTTTFEKRPIPMQKIRQKYLSKGWNHHKSDVLMLRGMVRAGQKIESRKHIVITGDVNPGAEIRVGGDIIVLGRLAGKFHAGYPDNSKAIIFALEFKPVYLQIGKITFACINRELIAKPEYACIEDDKIVVKDYMKDNPFKKMPWLETM